MPRNEEETEKLTELGLAYLYGEEGKSASISRAYECFSTAAKYGNVEAQSWLSFMYYYSLWGNHDFEKAKYWAEKAAAQGDAISAATLGEMYEYGEGVTKDLDQAVYWYERAVESGFKAPKKKLKQLHKNKNKKPINQFLFFEFRETDSFFVRVFTVSISFLIYSMIIGAAGAAIYGIVWFFVKSLSFG